jgi:hypothetical protein
LVIDCSIREGDDILLYDWKTGKSLSEDLSVQLSCYSLYALEKWNIPSEHLKVIEFNLSFNKANWFSITKEHAENSKGYIKGSIKEMQSLLIDAEKNIPMEEERFSKVEDEMVSNRCNFRRVCRQSL